MNGSRVVEQYKDTIKQGLAEKYKILAESMYAWKMPEGIPKQYPEHYLYRDGQCAMARYKDMYVIGSIVAESVYTNLYNEPVKWRMQFDGNFMDTEIRTHVFTEKDSVIIRESKEPRRPMSYINAVIDDMINNKISQRININMMRTPLVFYGDFSNQLTQRNLANTFWEGQPFMFLSDKSGKSMMSTDTQVLNNHIEYVADKIEDYTADLENDIFDYLGINSLANEKKERMLTDEVNASTEQLSIIKMSCLEKRQEAVDKINDLWGLDVAVEEAVFNGDDGRKNGQDGGEDGEID